MRPFCCPNQLIQLDLYRFRISVLGALDQKNHQKSNNRGRRIDYQLPRIAVMENRPRNQPGQDCPDCERENNRPSTKP